MKKTYTIIILFLFVSKLFGNSKISVDPIPLMSQLPSHSVQRIHQDKNGFLWFGTLDGLARYDGYRLLTFRSDLVNPHLLTNNEITSIAEGENCILVGTKKGLNILNKKNLSIVPFPDEHIQNFEIKAILVASDSTVWVGANNLIHKYDKNLKLIERYDNGEKLPINGISSIYEDQSNNIWISIWSSGLHKYNKVDNTFTHYPPIGKRNNPFKIFQDKHKQYWICTWGDGLYQFNPNADIESMYVKHEIKNHNKQSYEDTFFSITQDNSQNYIWLMSYTGVFALERDENGMYKQVDVSHLFKGRNNIFSELIKDREGNLWIGAFSEGVFFVNFNKPNIENIPIKKIEERLNTITNIPTFYIDRDERIWFIQNRYGLNVYDKKTDELLFFRDFPGTQNYNELRNLNTICGFRNSNKIWVGAENTSYIFEIEVQDKQIKVLKRIDLENIQANPGQVYHFFEDSKSNRWIITSTSVFCKPNNQNEIISVYSGLNDKITDITEDTMGNLWLSGSNSGLYYIPLNYNTNIANASIKHLQGEIPLPSNNISSIDTDSFGNIWIGTQEGNLICYNINAKTIQDQTQQARLSGHAIQKIIVDTYDQIWVSTNTKIFEYFPASGASRDYSTSDGVIVNSFLTGGSFASSPQKVYFAGNRGISAFTITEDINIPHNTEKSVMVTDIKSQGKSIINNPEYSNTDFTNQYFEINSDDKNLEIDFSSLDFTSLDKIRFAYMMEGIDDKWIYTDNRQFATYNQLKVGTNIFKVKASDSNKLWHDDYTTITIYKHPAFYETVWAYIAYVLIAVLLIYATLIIVRNRIRLRNQLKIAQIDKDKSEELTQTKLRYFTNISHDLLTPLTIISCLTDDLEMTHREKIPQFNIIRANVNRLKRLLQQVLDFRKMESGNMRLKVSRGNIVQFIHDICYTQFIPLIEKKHINMTFDSNKTDFEAYFDADKVDKIVFNLFSNAIKYTPNEGNVSIELIIDDKTPEHFITIKIKDSGVGINPEDLDKIFTRFYYNKATDASKTNGIGLSLTKDLIDMHGGTINVESEINKGSVFTVILPISKNQFTEDQLAPYSEDRILNNFSTSENSENTNIETDINDHKTAEIEDSLKETTILLVEDNEEILYTIEGILSKQYITHTATNGLDALEIVKMHNIDIIVSDVMMPKMDGLELCRTIKKDIATSHISVLLLTAKNSPSDRIECYNAGANGYISKPFDLNVLKARINNLVVHKKNRQQSFKTDAEINISTLEYPSQDEEFLKEAIQIIENNLSEPSLDVNFFAESLNMSKSSLYRKIKTMTNLSPVEFIRNIRLKHACRMLKNPTVSISDVAYTVGFSDPKYFTSCFKNEFGTTPSEYQKSQQEDPNKKE